MKIIVKDEKEKQELLKTCRYLHDFSVMFYNIRKRSRVEIVSSFDGSIPTERIKNFKECCGVSLDFDTFPILNLMVALVDAPEDIVDDIINETIIIEDHENKYMME